MIFHRSEGSGPAVVLIHGVGGDLASWDAVAAPLAERFQVIRMDLTGHGRSPLLKGPCTADDFARDVTGVMDELKVPSACIAGFSLGGQIAMALALSSPQRVRRMALVSTVAGRTDTERKNAVGRIDVLKEKGIGEIARGNVERWFTDAFRQKHPELVEARVKVLMQSDPISFLHAFTVFATAEFSERLSEIKVPTLIVTGEHDLSATPRMARLMHERIAGSRMEVLQGLRHSLLIEAPERVSALLGEFFSEGKLKP
jgi:(E)-2-((N-methylformamido)methylene)succinate hydrolase